MSSATLRSAPPTGASTRPNDPVAYLFVAFFTVPFFLFNILPVFFGAYVSLTRWSIIGTPRFIGLENFSRALADPWVWLAFKNVLLYGLVIVPGVTVLGLVFALFVNQRYPLSGLARTLFFAPNVVSATVIGLVWVWLLDTQFGLVNQLIGNLGIGPIPWLTSTSWSLIGVSIASIWWDLGLAFVLFLAALQDIPKDLTEAATVDGAGRFSRFWFIILPELRPVLSMVVTLQLISTSPIYYVYSMAIVRNLFGYASAIAMMLFVVILAVTLVQRLVLKERAR
jgi:multiple sugar transport system permease protein